LMMSLWDALRMNMMISYQELVRTFPNRSNSTTLANAISNSADVDIGLPRVLTGVQRVIFLENGVYFFR
ncbi:hypothetical protein AAGO60_26805, partial [Klebsiella pneumoniae]